MDVQNLTIFFMWCTIINGGLFFFSVMMCMLAPDFVYGMQSKFFPIPRDSYNVVIYAFFGLFKVVFLVFNVVPYVTLLIIS